VEVSGLLRRSIQIGGISGGVVVSGDRAFRDGPCAVKIVDENGRTRAVLCRYEIVDVDGRATGEHYWLVVQKPLSAKAVQHLSDRERSRWAHRQPAVPVFERNGQIILQVRGLTVCLDDRLECALDRLLDNGQHINSDTLTVGVGELRELLR
jgi:hypothetical protein